MVFLGLYCLDRGLSRSLVSGCGPKSQALSKIERKQCIVLAKSRKHYPALESATILMLK